MTDASGNFAGTVQAQGNGYQAGVGSLLNFSAVFTGSFSVPPAGPVTFNFSADDAFIFGVANGATRSSGPQNNTPANTPFQNYPVMGGVNQRSAPATISIVVNFPAPGVYLYEVDYAKGGDNSLTLTMTAGGAPIPAAPILTMTPIPFRRGRPEISRLRCTGDRAKRRCPSQHAGYRKCDGSEQPDSNADHGRHRPVQFEYSGAHAGVGTDLVQAQVTLNGATSISNAVSVTWNSGTNQAPIVEAGAIANSDALTGRLPRPER